MILFDGHIFYLMCGVATRKRIPKKMNLNKKENQIKKKKSKTETNGDCTKNEMKHKPKDFFCIPSQMLIFCSIKNRI